VPTCLARILNFILNILTLAFIFIAKAIQCIIIGTD
jgi:hypothetical protein